MESNDVPLLQLRCRITRNCSLWQLVQQENVVVVRGNTNLPGPLLRKVFREASECKVPRSDAYSVEFFRIFEHMRFRNHVQGLVASCKPGAQHTFQLQALIDRSKWNLQGPRRIF